MSVGLLAEVCCEVATWGTLQVATHLTAKPNPFYIEQLVHLIKMCTPLNTNQMCFHIKHPLHSYGNSTQFTSSRSAAKPVR